MATLQKNFPLEIQSDIIMGVVHSNSEENSSVEQSSSSCFGAIPMLPELITSKFTALGSHDRFALAKSGFETPKRKLLENRAIVSGHSTPESLMAEKELSFVNEEKYAAKVHEDEFILLDPSHLRDTSSYLVFEGNQALLQPLFHPISQVSSFSRPSETGDSTTEGAVGTSIHHGPSTGAGPMLDFDRRLQEDLPERQNHFVPICDDDEEEELLEIERRATQKPNKDQVATKFKLKPRKSRRMEDYEFTW